ncbi:ATP-binding protein [Sphingobacterium sp.]|uniref:sensor histidine kinase n=1 Tax=Sphingobacterium sp. TaxID=341027 RepID=UPI00289DC112|nr:ATP-binding protein [Sphingobacterium sp.]
METSNELWQKQETISNWILISVVFIFVLIATLIYIFTLTIHQRYKNKLAGQKAELQYKLALRDATLQSIESERKRFASELHDGIIGKMTAIRYSLQMNLAPIEVDSLLETCITESRSLSHQLYPPMLKDSGIDQLIQSCIQPYQTAITISYLSDIRSEIMLSEEQKLHVIRIIQELLTNTIKHAHASSVSIRIRIEKNILLRYTDNGEGVFVQNNPGIGLQSIHYRVMQLKGINKILTKGRGFKTLIYIPRCV